MSVVLIVDDQEDIRSSLAKIVVKQGYSALTAASGGEARYLIDQGLVRVNGEVETRRRRKCRPGDLVVFAGTALRVAALSPADGTGQDDGEGFSG